jgi:hypothetical protein
MLHSVANRCIQHLPIARHTLGSKKKSPSTITGGAALGGVKLGRFQKFWPASAGPAGRFSMQKSFPLGSFNPATRKRSIGLATTIAGLFIACDTESASSLCGDGDGEAVRLPTIQGIIDRRILVNYRVDTEVAARLLPAPFRPKLAKGYAMAGICLIRSSGRWGCEPTLRASIREAASGVSLSISLLFGRLGIVLHDAVVGFVGVDDGDLISAAKPAA